MRNLRPTLEYAWERTERLGNLADLTSENQGSTKIVCLELDDKAEIFPSSLTGSKTDQRLASREEVYGSIVRLSGEFYLIPTGRKDSIFVDKKPFTQEAAKQIAEQHAKLYSNKKLKAEGEAIRDDIFYMLSNDHKKMYEECMICLTGKYTDISKRYVNDLATIVMYLPVKVERKPYWDYFIRNVCSLTIKLKPIIYLPSDICIDFSNPEKDGSSMEKAYKLCSGEEM